MNSDHEIPMHPIPAADVDPRSNALLCSITASEWCRWSIYLEPVKLSFGQVLSEPGRASAYVYFPTTAIVSLVYMTEDGASSELAVIGHEGIVGISQFMGGDTMPYQAMVQGAGLGFRLRAQVVSDEMQRGGALMQRLLLLALDRMPSGVLPMTQELLASLLGVRREGVTAAALRLQASGAIRYSRGRIDVLDRAQLSVQALDRPLTGRHNGKPSIGHALPA